MSFFFGGTTAVVTSEGVNGLYAAGTISHSLDFRKSAGGGGGGERGEFFWPVGDVL